MPNDHASRPIPNPMRFCEQLYAVVVGLGLALAAGQVVNLSRPGIPIAAEHIPLFVAYLSFAFSLSHGAVRYLDLVYVEGALGPVGMGRAILDVLVDGVRMWWLIVLSLFVVRPVLFGYVVVFVLITGELRGFVGRVLHLPQPELERRFDRVNLAMLVATATIVLVAQLGFDDGAEDWIVRIGIQASALAYPFALYVASFREFFGEIAQQPS